MKRETVKSLKLEIERQNNLFTAMLDAKDNQYAIVSDALSECKRREDGHKAFIQTVFNKTASVLTITHNDPSKRFDFSTMLVEIARHLGADL